jgi:sugar phosphate isomerase/epimerase
VESIREIAEEAAGKGIVLCLENILFEPWAVDRTYRDLLNIKERVGVPCLKYTLDFGHARLSGGIAEGIKALGRDIYHIHVSDNNGDGDDHRVFGRGDLDYSPYLDFLKSFPGFIVMEVMGLAEDARSRALESRKNLLKLLQEQGGHAV